MSDNKKGFWQTVPGIFTGIAALITALAGLLIAAHQIGFLDDTAEETPAPTEIPSTPTTVALPTETQLTPVPGPPDMVYVPAGEIRIGEGAAAHEVYLESYFIDVYEVTNAQFELFVEQTGYETEAEDLGGGWVSESGEETPGADWRHPTGPDSSISLEMDHPVVQVSWDDCTAYCQWNGKRLPTEAEWERAARGTDRRTYPWGNYWDGSMLNYCDSNCPLETKDHNFDDGYSHTAPVGSYPGVVSPCGAYDMAGNVWEWVDTSYDEESKVVRGGAWIADLYHVRAAWRGNNDPTYRSDYLGCRCAQ